MNQWKNWKTGTNNPEKLNHVWENRPKFVSNQSMKIKYLINMRLYQT